MGEGVEEDGVEGAGGAVHGAFDHADNLGEGDHHVIGDFCMREEGEECFGAAFKAGAAVAVAGYGVVLCDVGFGGDDARETRLQSLLELGGVCWLC